MVIYDGGSNRPLNIDRASVHRDAHAIIYRVVYERIPHTDPAAAAAGCDSAGKVDIVPSESNYAVYRRYVNADKDVERGYDRSPYPFPSKIYDVPLGISLTCTRYFSNIIVNCNGFRYQNKFSKVSTPVAFRDRKYLKHYSAFSLS
ncbi:hypothetical protein QTP88_008466 [Uroleucon formosanum]